MNLVDQYKNLDAHVMRFTDRMISWAGLNRQEMERVLDQLKSMAEFPVRFTEAAEMWRKKAEGAAAEGREITASDWYFMAFGCYRQADFYYSKDGSGRLDAYDASVDCFKRATAGMPSRPEPVSLTLDGVEMHGYKIVPVDAPKPCPGVVIIYGADGNKEDHLLGTLGPAIRRGLAAMIVDGPGQGATLRRNRVPVRHDIEVFASPCLDLMQADPRIASDRIGIVGTSFGGYSAVRALAREPRFKAGLAISGLYDVVSGVFDPYPPVRPQLTYNVGAKSEAEAREKLRTFTLKGVIENAKQPLAIFHGEADPLIPTEQPKLIYDNWGGPKKLTVWPGANHNLINVTFAADPDMWDWLAAALRA
jgi:dipeptidyl aminopeptidase/acylaminoacyl peptidase